MFYGFFYYCCKESESEPTPTILILSAGLDSVRSGSAKEERKIGLCKSIECIFIYLYAIIQVDNCSSFKFLCAVWLVSRLDNEEEF